MDSGIKVEKANLQVCGNYGPDGLSIYIHIPFCETKCHYCDFNTYAGIEA